MRAFIGIELPWDIKKSIIEIQNVVKLNSERGRWKYIDNFHLTLKFLGEVSERQINTVFENMKANMRDVSSFNLTTCGIGCFKGQGCLRVIYINLEDTDNVLNKFFKITEDSCFASGIAREKRKYTPHITIAQDVVLNWDFNTIKDKTAELSRLPIPVKEICIIKSEQIDNKRIYTPIRCLKL